MRNQNQQETTATEQAAKSLPVDVATEKKLIGGLTNSEVRVRAQEAVAARFERLRTKLSESAFDAVSKTPPTFLGRRLKALLGEASSNMAIRAKCESCVGYEEVAARVGDCRSRSCELWTYRPYQDQQAKHASNHD